MPDTSIDSTRVPLQSRVSRLVNISIPSSDLTGLLWISMTRRRPISAAVKPNGGMFGSSHWRSLISLRRCERRTGSLKSSKSTTSWDLRWFSATRDRSCSSALRKDLTASHPAQNAATSAAPATSSCTALNNILVSPQQTSPVWEKADQPRAIAPVMPGHRNDTGISTASVSRIVNMEMIVYLGLRLRIMIDAAAQDDPARRGHRAGLLNGGQQPAFSKSRSGTESLPHNKEECPADTIQMAN